MGDEEKLKIIIEAHNKAKAAFDQANRQVNGLERNFEAMGARIDAVSAKMRTAGKAMAIGLTLPILAVGAAAAQSLIRIEQIGAQTDAVLKSTGNAANTTRKHIDKLAGNLENLTGAEAESTTMGQNMLLTFTNIKNGVGKGNQIFDQATKTMLDMGTAMNGGVVPAGEQLKGTAIQLGKALNDPVKGITALTKVGVTFTKEQKEQIKTMVDAGDTMGAQKVILAELNKEFGGSAEAFGKTTAGKVAILKHRFGTLTEEIMSRFMPGIIKVVEKVSGAFDAFTRLSEGQKKLITILLGVAAALGPVLWIFGMLSTAVGFLISPVGLVIIAFVAMATGLVLLYKKSEKFREIVAKVGQVIKEHFGAMVKVFKEDFLPAIQELWTKAQPILKVLGVILGVVIVGAILVIVNVMKYWMLFVSNVLLPVIYVLGEVLFTVFTAISTVVSFAWGIIKPIWDLFYAIIANVLIPVIQLLWAVVSPIFTLIWLAIKSMWDFAQPYIQELIDAWGHIQNALAIAWDWIDRNIINKISGIIDWVAKFTEKLGAAVNAVKDFLQLKNETSKKEALAEQTISQEIYAGTFGRKTLTPAERAAADAAYAKYGVSRGATIGQPKKKASGGPLSAGDWSWVGEKGPELIHMPRSGMVYSNQQSQAMAGVTNTFTGNIILGDASAVKEFFKQLNRDAEKASMGVPT